MREARRRAAVRPCHTTGVQKTNAFADFVPRHVRMTVQQHIDVLRRSRWRNVDEPEANAVPLHIRTQRPFKIAVAVSTNDRKRRSHLPNRPEQRGRANIAEVPDFVDARRELFQVRRQVIVSVPKDEDANCLLAHRQRRGRGAA